MHLEILGVRQRREGFRDLFFVEVSVGEAEDVRTILGQ